MKTFFHFYFYLFFQLFPIFNICHSSWCMYDSLANVIAQRNFKGKCCLFIGTCAVFLSCMQCQIQLISPCSSALSKIDSVSKCTLAKNAYEHASICMYEQINVHLSVCISTKDFKKFSLDIIIFGNVQWKHFLYSNLHKDIADCYSLYQEIKLTASTTINKYCI